MERVLVVGFTGNIGGLESVVMNYYRKFDKNKVQLDFLYSTDTIAFEDEIKERTYRPKHEYVSQYNNGGVTILIDTTSGNIELDSN